MAEFPYAEGDVVVLGPECFASADGAVICWKGQNYVPMEDPDRPAPPLALWSCRVGEVDRSLLPQGRSDAAMREAVERAYFALTGEQPVFLFSGWGDHLPEPERAVVEDRLPRGPEGHDG